jgi:phosphatidylglycerophosphatase C
MSASEPAAQRRWLALFDLDGTLTWHDTLLPFLMSFLRRNPSRLFGLWRLPLALASFAWRRDRGALKSQLIRMIMGGAAREAVDSCAGAFVDSLQPRKRFRAGALAALETHRTSGDLLVLLSASPDLYVPRVGRSLGFERTLCTQIAWRGDRLDGALVTPNRRGAEKLQCLHWLRAQYPGMPIVAYGNSASDLDHMQHADRALLVNANAAARALAAKCGIPTTDWT